MLESWRDEWRKTPDPSLWRAALFAVVVILVLTWPLLRGRPINTLPAVLAGLAGLALVVDLTRLGWTRLRRR